MYWKRWAWKDRRAVEDVPPKNRANEGLSGSLDQISGASNTIMANATESSGGHKDDCGWVIQQQHPPLSSMLPLHQLEDFLASMHGNDDDPDDSKNNNNNDRQQNRTYQRQEQPSKPSNSGSS